MSDSRSRVLSALVAMRGADGWSRPRARAHALEVSGLASWTTWRRCVSALAFEGLVIVEDVSAWTGVPASYRVTDEGMGRAAVARPGTTCGTTPAHLLDSSFLLSSPALSSEDKKGIEESGGVPRHDLTRPTGTTCGTTPPDTTSDARLIAEAIRYLADALRPAPVSTVTVSAEPALQPMPVVAAASAQTTAGEVHMLMLEAQSNAGLGSLGHVQRAREYLVRLYAQPGAPSPGTILAGWQRDCARWAIEARDPEKAKFRKHMDTWVRDQEWQRAHVESDADRAEREKAARAASRAAAAQAERKREQDEAAARQRKDMELAEQFRAKQEAARAARRQVV